MADGNTRATATQILTQLADLLGVQSPTTGTNTASQIAQRRSSMPEQGAHEGSSTNGLVRSEMSRLFAPYPRPSSSAVGVRLAGRPAMRQRPAPVRQLRQWTARYCCLGGPLETKTPIESRMLLLKRHGLGDDVITIDTTATADRLKEALESTFPKLVGVEVGLFRAVTGGKGKPIVRICNMEPIPGVPHLRAARVSLIYIQPITDILNVEDETEQPYQPLPLNVVLEQPPPVDVAQARTSVNTGQAAAEFGGEVQSFQTHNSTMEIPSNQELLSSHDEGNETIAEIPPQDEEILTLEHYREQLYIENEGFQYILASRERFLEKILGIYKDPRFNFLKKPKVEFQGEPGADIGAITREFFWKGLTAIVQEKVDGLPLFDGEIDHKVPATDGRLLRAGIFKTVGMFLGHAALHCGIAFIGLSEAVAQYLFLDDIDSDTPLTITVEDIPETHVRDAITLLTKLKSGATLTQDEAAHVQDVAESSEFGETVTKGNAGFVIEQILYHAVIDRRVGQLEALKAGFRCAGLSNFIRGKHYLMESLFPRNSALSYPSGLILSKIQCQGSREKLAVVTTFIQSLERLPGGLQNLLSAWTGWPVLPEDSLTVRFEDDADFMEFLIDCFRNPACRKKPENLPYHLGIKLDPPRVQGMDQCPPFVPPHSYRETYIGCQPRLNNRYRNAAVGSSYRPEREPLVTPDLPQQQRIVAKERIEKEGPEPLQETPVPEAPQSDLRQFWANLMANGDNHDIISQGNPSAARSTEDKNHILKNSCYTPPQQATTATQEDLARHLSNSLRSIIAIGNDAPDLPCVAESRQIEQGEAGDERQQYFQKIMEELVMNGTKKVFESKKTLGMVFGI